MLLLQSKLDFAKGKYQTALAAISKANKLVSQYKAPPKYQVQTLSWLGRCNIEWLQLDSAAKNILQAQQILKKSDIPDLALSNELSFNQALLKIDQQEYHLADSILLILEKNSSFKRIHPILHYSTKIHLGESQLEQENFAAAEEILTTVSDELIKAWGIDHYLHSFVYLQLGRLYDKMGNQQKGQNIFKQALLNCEKNYDTTHPHYGRLLNHIGNLLVDIGAYQKAEELLLKAKTINLSTFGKHPRYALVLAGLEELYQKMGQPEKELKYALEQKEIFLAAGHFSDYATSINNLSYTYQERQEFDKADRLLDEGIRLLKTKKQTKTGIYAILLMNYAGLNIDLGNHEKSEKSFEEAQQLLLEIYGKEHPWYAAVINNLAFLYETTGKYQQAKKLYIETEEIDRTTLGTKHPYYIHTTYNLAKINRLTKDFEATRQYYTSANEGQVDLIYNYYSGFDEETRLDYLKKTEEGFHRFYSFAFDHIADFPAFGKDLQNLNLAVKNLALDFSADNQSVANEIKDTAVAKKYDDWLAVKKQLSQSYIQSADEQAAAGIHIEKLEEQAELLEKELVRSEVIAASKLETKKRATYENLKAHIQANEAVIDFIRFPYYAANRLTDSVYYAALVSRQHFDAPKMVWLGEEKQLKRFLRSNVRQNGSNYVENDRIGKDLYTQIWQPLSPYLEGVKNINISASGLLYKVAFAALATDGKPLIDQYNFTYFGNLRTFGKVTNEQPNQPSIALFGGANFNLDSITLTQIAQDYQENNSTNLTISPTEIIASNDTSNTRSAVVFNYLAGTEKEVETIKQQFQNKKWQTKTFLSNNALEENFKLLNGKKAPSILHIATHGYFFAPLKKGRKVPDNARGRIMSAKNPLLRSGLAFTGANYSWKLGKRIPNLEDGILTAYEIANQNLSHTNLVVLSACETGLGDVVNGEGVFGLQRAFKMAGVKNMLISLWKVHDQQTQELMTTFYEYYLQSSDAADALHQAQLKMSQQYRPFYWAGFILAK